MKIRPRVLIVDDVAENRKLIARYVRDNTDYEISLARNGASALAGIRRHPPDLILLDITMPDMDGFAVASEIRSLSTATRIPILFITAVADSSSVAKIYELGVDYVRKPVYKPEFLARVRAHMELKLLRDGRSDESERQLNNAAGSTFANHSRMV